MASKKYFINFTNHPSAFWDECQRLEALRYGDEILDIPFPDIPATATETEIIRLAEEYADKLQSFSPAAVLCQGEFTFSYQIITLLLEYEIPVVAACSRRSVIEEHSEGKTIKHAEYKFIKFRHYTKHSKI